VSNTPSRLAFQYVTRSAAGHLHPPYSEGLLTARCGLSAFRTARRSSERLQWARSCRAGSLNERPLPPFAAWKRLFRFPPRADTNLREGRSPLIAGNHFLCTRCFKDLTSGGQPLMSLNKRVPRPSVIR
jgi:hypothetical protein